MTAGRAKMGEPQFYPLQNKAVYITPLYVKEGNANVVKNVVITDASSSTIEVGSTIQKAMETFLKG